MSGGHLHLREPASVTSTEGKYRSVMPASKQSNCSRATCYGSSLQSEKPGANSLQPFFRIRPIDWTALAVTVHGMEARGTGPCFGPTSLVPKCTHCPKDGPVPDRGRERMRLAFENVTLVGHPVSIEHPLQSIRLCGADKGIAAAMFFSGSSAEVVGVMHKASNRSEAKNCQFIGKKGRTEKRNAYCRNQKNTGSSSLFGGAFFLIRAGLPQRTVAVRLERRAYRSSRCRADSRGSAHRAGWRMRGATRGVDHQKAHVAGTARS